VAALRTILTRETSHGVVRLVRDKLRFSAFGLGLFAWELRGCRIKKPHWGVAVVAAGVMECDCGGNGNGGTSCR
jgi:hypothetical protein